MFVELTTNGWNCHTGHKHILLGRCLEACLIQGPIIAFHDDDNWVAHNITPGQGLLIPKTSIAEEYRLVRDPDSMFPVKGVVYVLNREPKLHSRAAKIDQPAQGEK